MIDSTTVWAITMLFSFCVFVVTIIGFIIKIRRELCKDICDSKLVTSLNILVIGVFFSLFIIYAAYNYSIEKNVVNAILVACFHAVRVFLANEDIFVLHETVKTGMVEIDTAIMIYISLIFILAPVLLISAVLIFFEDALHYFKFRIFPCGKLYIFSALSEKSIALAEDIAKISVKGDVLLFTGVVNKSENDVYSLYKRTKNINAICIKGDIDSIPFYKKVISHDSDIFLINTDDNINLKYGIVLTEKYNTLYKKITQKNKKFKLNIYVFAGGMEYGTIIDSLNTELKASPIYISRIDEAYIKINELLMRRPLFLCTQNKQINALILGSGRIATEAIKAIAWCGQMEGYQLRIKVFTNEEQAESRFKMICPELISKDYDISFVTLDVTTNRLTEEINHYQNATYVIVALGDDDLNIKTSMQLRSLYKRLHYSESMDNVMNSIPFINVAVEDESKSMQISKLSYSNKVRYNLLPFGDINSLFKVNTVINPTLEKLACSVHCEYCGGEETPEMMENYIRNEYNRRSSIAAAIFLKYQIFVVLEKIKGNEAIRSLEYDWVSNIPTSNMVKEYLAYLSASDSLPTEKEEVSRQRTTALAIMTHNRWNAYTRSLGFERAALFEVEEYYDVISHHVHKLAKKHPCLVEWEELDAVTAYMRTKQPNSPDYKEVDKILINNVEAIYSRLKSFDYLEGE